MSARLLLAGLLLAAGLTGCGGEDDAVGTDEPDPTAVLEQQRSDVRAAAAELVKGATETLGGRASQSLGGFQGCESAFNEEYRTFRYRATGRVDAGPAARRPYLEALEGVLSAAGFPDAAPGERPGGRTLAASRSGLDAEFSELPGQGVFVLLAVEGPCVEVPEDQRGDWGDRTDAEPYS